MSSRRRAGIRLGSLAVMIGGLVFTATPCTWAAAASLAVTPTTGITDGQALDLTLSGFPAGDEVFLVQCARGTTAYACNLADGDVQSVTVDENGNATASLPARRTFVGVNPTTGATAGAVDCAVAPGCAIVASVDRTSPIGTPVAISFA